MQNLRLLPALIAIGLILTGCATPAAARPPETQPPVSNPSANCPVTLPGAASFEAPAPFSPNAPFGDQFWFGTENLWTALPNNGTWSGLPLNPGGYTQKVFWWSKQFSFEDEPQPNLVVSGKRLDGDAPALHVSRATNAEAGDIGTAMLVGVDFPTVGCWQITGQYKGSELSFVVSVEP